MYFRVQITPRLAFILYVVEMIVYISYNLKLYLLLFQIASPNGDVDREWKLGQSLVYQM